MSILISLLTITVLNEVQDFFTVLLSLEYVSLRMFKDTVHIANIVKSICFDLFLISVP